MNTRRLSSPFCGQNCAENAGNRGRFGEAGEVTRRSYSARRRGRGSRMLHCGDRCMSRCGDRWPGAWGSAAGGFPESAAVSGGGVRGWDPHVQTGGDSRARRDCGSEETGWDGGGGKKAPPAERAAGSGGYRDRRAVRGNAHRRRAESGERAGRQGGSGGGVAGNLPPKARSGDEKVEPIDAGSGPDCVIFEDSMAGLSLARQSGVDIEPNDGCQPKDEGGERGANAQRGEK